jgi:hypothetical protein
LNNHISLAVRQFLAKNKIPPILLSQHSPDITACDFWVFLRLRIGLKGNCCASAEEIQQNSATGLNTHPKRGLVDGAPLCVKGRFFEGDLIILHTYPFFSVSFA